MLLGSPRRRRQQVEVALAALLGRLWRPFFGGGFWLGGNPFDLSRLRVKSQGQLFGAIVNKNLAFKPETTNHRQLGVI